MPSSNDGDRQKKPESGNASGEQESVPRGHDQKQNPPTTAPQPAMGYPPTMGYPPPGPGGHPPPPGPYPPHYNPYGPYPPAPGYYPSPNPYQNPQLHVHPQASFPVAPSPYAGFIRGVITAVIVLVIISCIFSIATYIILRPMLPDYHMTSFTFTDMNVSNGELKGDWAANITVHNHDTKQKANIDKIQAYMFYKNIVNYLSWSSVPPFSLDPNGTSAIQVKDQLGNHEHPPEWMLEDLRKDRESGSVKVDVGLTMLGTFKSGSWWTTHLSIRVYCYDLNVVYNSPTNVSGSVAPGDLPKKCLAYA